MTDAVDPKQRGRNPTNHKESVFEHRFIMLCSGCGGYIGTTSQYRPYKTYCDVDCELNRALDNDCRDSEIVALITDTDVTAGGLAAELGISRAAVSQIVKRRLY